MSARSLPPELQDAVEELLAGGRGGLVRDAADLQAAYGGALSSSSVSVDAYLATRMPATYAAVSRVFDLISAVAPDFNPKSMLDVGAGPGTASWAAVEAWTSLNAVTMLERDKRFAEMASRFLKGASHAALAQAEVVIGDMTKPATPADLVVAAYVFAEQPETASASLALDLWKPSRNLLVIIEPGTPDGFARVRAARQALLDAGAYPVAPCPHGASCPMAGEDWCHFKTRLPRSRLHMQAKGASVPFEDESFSFIAVSREKLGLPEARILAPPTSNKTGASLKLCRHGRVEHLFIASRDKPAYKLAKKKAWGDDWR